MLALVLSAVAVLGQGPPAAVRSPEVHPDRTVTFRLRAPQASLVELSREVLRGGRPQAMTKGSDGVWSVTIGPLPPEIWVYNFRVQGVDLPDPVQAKKSFKLVFLGSGQAETGLLEPGKKLAAMLQEKGFNVRWSDYPGGHVFSVWRNHLNESVPLLFRK